MAVASGLDRRWRAPARVLAWAVACLALGGLLAALLPLDAGLDRRHDWQTALWAPQGGSGSVVVDVDEASVQQLGTWPLPRDAYLPAAQWLLDQGARALAFGVLMVDAREGAARSGDERFGAWLAQARAPVLLGARGVPGPAEAYPAQPAPTGCQALRVGAWQLPLWAAARPSAGPAAVLPLNRVGVLSVPVADADGVLRAWPLWQQAGALVLPTMPMAVWQAVNPAAAADLRCADGHLQAQVGAQTHTQTEVAGAGPAPTGPALPAPTGAAAAVATATAAATTAIDWPLDAQQRVWPWLPRAEGGAPPPSAATPTATPNETPTETPATAPAIAPTDGSAHWPRTVSLGQVLAAAQGRLPPAEQQALARAVRGRVVFIGASAQSLGDSVATGQGWHEPTRLLALAYDALDQGRLLVAPRPATDAALLAVTTLPLGLGLGLAWRRRAAPLRPVLWSVAAALALLLLLDQALVAMAGRLSHLGWPLATLALMAGSLWWRQRRQAQRAQAALHAARTEAAAVARVKTEFLAQISHEVRTPLNALLGAAELLQATPLSAEQQRHVGLFNTAGHELLDMLNDLLDLSKSEAGLLSLDPQPFSLTQLVAQQLALFEAPVAQKGLVLEVDSEPELPEVVVGDGARVAQVLRNLLSNAVKFTSVGRITLGLRFGRDRDHVRIEVRDTGIGVPAHRVHQLFSPYAQLHERRHHPGGTGLGLAISRRLVDLMGGTIGVHSREGLGATFHVELPLPASRAQPVDLAVPAGANTTTRPALPLDATGGQGAGRRVLVADDSMLNLVLLRALLEGAGWRVDTAADGAAALRQFERGGHDAVLLDLNMPVMDGYSAVQAMRQWEQRRQRPPTRIVAVSGQVDAQEVAAALAAGFDAHLGKPYARAELLRLLGGLAPVAGADAATDAAGADTGAAGALAHRSGAGDAANSSWMDLVSQLPDNDLPQAVSRMGSASLFDRVFDAGRDTLLQFDPRLTQALARAPADADAARRLAHNLKGVAATVGLAGLARDAERLEQALARALAPAHDEAVQLARERVTQRLAPLRAALSPDGGAVAPRRAAGGG